MNQGNRAANARGNSNARGTANALPPPLSAAGRPGRRGTTMSPPTVPLTDLPKQLLRAPDDPIRLPEVCELDVVRHFTRLSQANMSIDTNFYPLGSCTMKYNPKVNEEIARLPGFSSMHPLADESQCQGSLQIMHHLQTLLGGVSGFHGISLQPAAGAQGELAGVLMIRAYHKERGDTARRTILVPDSAHGTNPATARMAGCDAVQLPSDSDGNLDLDALKAACGKDVAGLMLTNPNTLGLFEQQIEAVVDVVHQCGGLVYGDGANLNAILGVVRPADLGIDVMHFNLHKTFSTPHGGGGPGSGPVGATEDLAPFLPGPVVSRHEEAPRYRLTVPEQTIGRLKSFHGNFGMILRAYAYVRMLGARGLRRVAENAVLNANYLKHLVADIYPTRYARQCMHEFVSAGNRYESVSTMDVAKRLLDYGVHAPTVYFPLIVKDALMIEPTECETRETLDAFSAVLHQIAREAQEEPELLHDAPTTTPIGRLDEVEAVRKLILTDYENE